MCCGGGWTACRFDVTLRGWAARTAAVAMTVTTVMAMARMTVAVVGDGDSGGGGGGDLSFSVIPDVSSRESILRFPFP